MLLSSNGAAARHKGPPAALAGLAGQKTPFSVTTACLSQFFGQKLQIAS